MNRQRLEEWIKESGATETTTFYANRINYFFATLPDGWTAIFENNNGDYTPLIQAADRAHAESYCILREPLPVPAQRI